LSLLQLPEEQLLAREQVLSHAYTQWCAAGLKLDLTRGKPSPAQLDLSDALLGPLEGGHLAEDGTDARNYGGLDGLPEAKRLGAALLEVGSDEVLVGGNSSLELMYRVLFFSHFFGLRPDATPWREQGGVKFLCPVPGYDRHFSICQHLGIEMVPVALTGQGPDMAQVEALIGQDPSIKGIWCVPKYANPTGETYSDETVARIAALGRIAPKDFVVMWDNAYTVHDLHTPGDALANLMELARRQGTQTSIFITGSTSKITHAGAGISFLASAPANLARFRAHLGMKSIGPDKVNQLRHVRFLKDEATLHALMQQHAAILRPKFERVLQRLEAALGGKEIASWTSPRGGYFISFNTLPGLASEVVGLCRAAGVALTPAGASFPYGRDPQDSNIRLAPSFPSLEEIDRSMEVFVLCVELATLRQRLASRA